MADLSYLSGMPAHLRATAQRNLATEDEKLARVNAVRSTTAVMPGVGAAGSTPQTDVTNLRVAGSMTAGQPQVPVTTAQDDDGIDLNVVNDRRSKILQGIDPDRPAMFVNKQRRRELQNELGTLTQIAHQTSMEKAYQAKESYKQQKDIEAASAFSSFTEALKGIKAQPGTPEYRSALSKAALDNITGVRTAEGLRLAQMLADEHKEAAALRAAFEKEQKENAPVQAPEGYTAVPASVTQGGKTRYAIKPNDPATKDAPSEIVARYARRQAELAKHQVGVSTEEKSNIAAGAADVPYSKSEDLAEARAEAAILESKYPQLKTLAAETGPAKAAEAKPLDMDTAKKLFTEAGGDKAKARALAKERGYTL